MMNILEVAEDVRQNIRRSGSYRKLAIESGVGFEWLNKFANKRILNPGIKNVARLDLYFKRKKECDTEKKIIVVKMADDMADEIIRVEDKFILQTKKDEELF